MKPWRAFHQAQMAKHRRAKPSEERKYYRMAVDRFEKDSDEEKILILHWWTRPKLEMKKQEVCEGTFTE